MPPADTSQCVMLRSWELSEYDDDMNQNMTPRNLIFSFLTSNLKVTILEDTELVSVATTLKSDNPNGAS